MELRVDEKSLLSGNRGVALVIALIITLVVFLLIGSVIFMSTQSTIMSGAGKRYATAQEAADGAVEVIKEAIKLSMDSEDISGLGLTGTGDLHDVVKGFNGKKIAQNMGVTLAGTGVLATSFQATAAVERLYNLGIPGGPAKFPPERTGHGGEAIFYRVNTVVQSANNTKGESSVLYRYVP